MNYELAKTLEKEYQLLNALEDNNNLLLEQIYSLEENILSKIKEDDEPLYSLKQLVKKIRGGKKNVTLQ